MTFRRTLTSALLGAALLGFASSGTHAQLPPEVEADRLLLIARDSMEAKEWGKAREAFESILALGIAVPPDFHYHYARALSESGRAGKAKEQLTLYLGQADRGSETYRDALALFNKVDAEAKRAAEDEQKAAAAAEQKKEQDRKAAARADEQAKKLRDRIAKAEAGDADAQEALGNSYMYGTDGVKRDYAQAKKWYERGAAQEHAGALSGLAYLYINGWGVTRDYAKVYEYYLRGAKKDNRDAVHGIGVLHQNGWGVKKDLAIAAQWFRKGAELGHSSSQNNLGGMYLTGEGVPQNRDIAYDLFQKAAAQGLKRAQDNLKKHFPGYYNFN